MVVVLLLLATLAAASYYVIRGPARMNAQGEDSAALPPTQPPETPPNPPPPPDEKATAQSPVEKKPKDGAEPAAEKKTTEARTPETKVLPEKPAPNPPVATAPGPTGGIPSPATPNTSVQTPEQTSPSDGGCIGVALMGTNGQPGRGIRLTLALESGDNYGGVTNKMGRWHQCGLAIGKRGKIIVFGPAGGGIASRAVIVNAGRNFVPIQIEGGSSPQVNTQPDSNNVFRPRRRPPFSRRPL